MTTILSIPLENGLKQFSRTAFSDSRAVQLSYNCVTVDGPRELGIILHAQHSGTSCSNTSVQ